ncbi:unnamed protein product [Acanthoscelides obtectus]|uniref:C2H2-type domain-containing protein n=1 Tax=Acanthoscelides obtectus TaxID=200917 RepID=A0A9P0NSI6_ACAOB|nr:unnamed protein product [Acanthoscelides obtectus]CAK1639693.1 Zinc finger protein 112 [Acanthoscelides obtectus]
MGDKFSNNYPNSYHQLSKQIQQSEMPYYPYLTIPIGNTFSPNFPEMHSNLTANTPRNQGMASNMYFEQPDAQNWENRALPDVEKVIKLPDKIELIEISSKDLSPVSVDLISDICKATNKDTNVVTRYDNQWYYNQRCYEYSSCAQLSNSNVSKYCTVQKNQEYDPLMKSCSYPDNIYSQNNESYFRNVESKPAPNDMLQDYNNYQYYDKYQENVNLFPGESYFNPAQQIPFEPSMSQQTEESNESDIIVEESDDDVTDYSEDQEKRVNIISHRCIVCNLVYAPLGIQFYFLTKDTPLTMSSQIPVIRKISGIVGNIPNDVHSYLCSECLGLINTIDHLEFRLKDFNQELITKFEKTCEINGKTCPPKANAHVKMRKKKVHFQKYRCKICKKVLCFKQYYLYHYKKHQRKILCEQCGKIFSNRSKFNIHVKKHNLISIHKIDSFKCFNCDKNFRTKSNLKEHENYCTGAYPFDCKYCDKKFASSTKLKNHVKLKHDKKFVAICSICNIGFIKVSDYKSHMVTHSTEKKFSCKKCDKSYKTVSNLNFHMKVHEEILPFICSICKKGFMRKEYLEAHVSNHNGIKNYNCTICDKKFVSQKNLDAHLKYHDGTLVKHTCNICEKKVTTGFEEHLRIHSNLKEYECQYCDMRFNTKGTLRKHIVKKHPNDK